MIRSAAPYDEPNRARRVVGKSQHAEVVEGERPDHLADDDQGDDRHRPQNGGPWGWPP